jgi:hypothetical protein
MANYTTGGCGVIIVSEVCPCENYENDPTVINRATGEAQEDFCKCNHHLVMHSTVEVQ